MENQNPINIQEIVSVRFKNPKFVYDGKRVQPVYDRKSYDYASGIIYETHIDPLINFSAKSCNFSSQILTIRPPNKSDPYSNAATKFVHMCINKIRSPVNVVLWNPDGRRLLSGSSSGEITMWNGFSFNFDTILQAHESQIKAMCWSNSSSFLITSDSMGILKYWNSSMNNLQEIRAHDEGIKDLCFSNNDSKFCTASDDSTIKIWDTSSSKEELILKGHNWDVRKAQWHRSLALIASGGKDNLLKLWDPRTSECLTTFHYHKNTILSLKFYKENYLLSGGKDQVIKMLDLRSMRECFTYKNQCKDVTSLAVHPFSDLFVSGNNEGVINHWDFMTDEPIAVSDKKHENTVWSLDFHPAGHILSSGSADFMVKFWVRPRPSDVMHDEEENHSESSTSKDEMPIPGL